MFSFFYYYVQNMITSELEPVPGASIVSYRIISVNTYLAVRRSKFVLNLGLCKVHISFIS